MNLCEFILTYTQLTTCQVIPGNRINSKNKIIDKYYPYPSITNKCWEQRERKFLELWRREFHIHIPYAHTCIQLLNSWIMTDSNSGGRLESISFLKFMWLWADAGNPCCYLLHEGVVLNIKSSLAFEEKLLAYIQIELPLRVQRTGSSCDRSSNLNLPQTLHNCTPTKG